MTEPHTHSPNWYWQQLGYTVERNNGRTIRRPDGSVVDIPRSETVSRHEMEIAAALREVKP